MIAVVIPVHNEERLLGACLRAVFEAAAHAGLEGEEVRVFVVLNGCSDGSERVARATPAEILVLDDAHVGAARRCGCNAAVAQGARWLAFTDADSVVADDWLAIQLAHGTEVVCGTVAVDDWSVHGAHAPALHRHFLETYEDRDGHRHIHGANLGVSTDAYLAVGGFDRLPSGEDVALVHALDRSGASISWTARPRVTTSARVDARARGGFGDTLRGVVQAMDSRSATHGSI